LAQSGKTTGGGVGLGGVIIVCVLSVCVSSFVSLFLQFLQYLICLFSCSLNQHKNAIY
jgi:hypothetical protein